MAKPNLTAARLRELLEYNAETGLFTWRNKVGSVSAGSTARGRNQEGYRNVSLDGKYYYQHRLAWLYVHGEWPTLLIDHINRETEGLIPGVGPRGPVTNEPSMNDTYKRLRPWHAGICLASLRQQAWRYPLAKVSGG